VNAPAAAAQQPIKHSTKFELHVFRLVSLNEKNSLGAVFFLLVALPLASAACTSGGNKTGTLLLAPDLWWRLVLPLAVRRSEFAVIEDVDTTTTWINDTMSFDESAIPGIGELSCADAFALAVPSFFVGSSLGDVDGWAQNWLGNRWSSLAAGTPGTVDIRVGLPGEMTTTTPSPWLPPWESTTTTTEVISLPLQAVSDVHAGAVTFLDVPGGGERSISTTRIVLNHQLSTVSTLTRANKEDPLARDKLNITHVNVTTFFAPFVRASLNNLWTFHSVVLRPLESDRFDKPPWLLQGGHDFVRVCTCDDRNATERCPATIHFKAVWGPSHICPVGAFVIKRHLPESQRWAPLQRQFSCVQFQEPPPSIAGVHNLTYDQLIVTIDGCRMVYDHGVVQMGGINDAELFAFTLSTARCRHAAYFVGCGPLIIAHSGRILQRATQRSAPARSYATTPTSPTCCAAAAPRTLARLVQRAGAAAAWPTAKIAATTATLRATASRKGTPVQAYVRLCRNAPSPNPSRRPPTAASAPAPSRTIRRLLRRRHGARRRRRRPTLARASS
jgi:hypothetical protein